MTLFVFENLYRQEWWQALSDLSDSLESSDRKGTSGAYRRLVAALARGGHESLGSAAARGLLDGEELLLAAGDPLPEGLREAALIDLETVAEWTDGSWQERCERLLRRQLPPLERLAGPDAEASDWLARLDEGAEDRLLDELLSRYRRCGVGLFARHRAFRWERGQLEGVDRPARDALDELLGLERQLERLTANVERFLAGAPALHTLLYGPRGSGKSTAVRALLDRYGGEGLRLVELPPESLAQLPLLIHRLGSAPQRFIAFVDDLSFGRDDDSYAPLKTVLEGSVRERPENVLLIATSNRRHLVSERFSDRPMPEDDEVHAWDSVNESLALADRFGLTITFPSADERAYLRLVRGIAGREGVDLDETGEREALRFAQWGNGYSGRTARQFVDTLLT